MYPDTELLFPPRLIRDLANLRGEEWARLVRHVAPLPETHPDVLAFMLTVSRLTDCLGCRQGSFRAWRGCAVCSQLAVSNFKGSDQELLEMYHQAQKEIGQFLAQAESELVRAA